VKYLSWLKKEAKATLSQGSEVSLNELLSKSSGLIATEGSAKVRKPRAAKKEKTKIQTSEINPKVEQTSNAPII